MYRGGTLIYPELSYKINGILFSAHNELGPYAREKQIADVLEKLFKENDLEYSREVIVGNSGNRIDFIIDKKIIIELKSVRGLMKNDYEQTQRYLQATQLKLAILVNFRNQYLKPIRIVKIDTKHKNKFLEKN